MAVVLAASWAPDRVRAVVMGLYLAATYGVLGMALVRASGRLAHQPTGVPTAAV